MLRWLAITFTLLVLRVSWLESLEMFCFSAGILWGCSLEYGLHRGPMHNVWGGRARKVHLEGHHGQRHAPTSFTTPIREPYRLGESAIPLVWFGHLAVLFFLWLGTRQTGVLVSLAGGITLYFFAYEWMHHEMHQPDDRWYSHFPPFQFQKALHRLHHQYGKINFGLACWLIDAIMGTLCTINQLPEASAGQESSRYTGPRSIFPWFPELNPRKLIPKI